jgi:hypothetical protein
MSSEVVTTSNPFAGRSISPHVSAGAVAIEQERAIAEAQGKLVIAKKFPRDQAKSFDAIMDACSRQGLAEEALYTYKRGGQTVSGPSIRLAEEMARCWGNIDYGLRELSRRDGESEMDAYAWDLETNTVTSQKFTVKHVRDTKEGRKVLSDERDIYEIGANNGARRMRARILAIIPGDIERAAVAKCRETLAGKSDVPMADRIRALVEAFKKLGVSSAMLEKYAGKKLDDMLPDEMVTLRGVYKSLNDGMSKASDWFGDTSGQKSESTAAKRVNAAIRNEPILIDEERQALTSDEAVVENEEGPF